MRAWRDIAIWLLVPLLLACLLLPPVPIRQPVHTLQLTFDISQSMNVADADLDNAATTRLQAAKRAARFLLTQLNCGSTAGLNAFAGKRSLVLMTPVEVCEHYDALLQALEQINGQMRWENASRVGKGLHQSLKAAATMAASSGNSTAVVYFSDGHEAPPLPQGHSGIPKLTEEPRTGLVVGVGGNSPQRIPKLDSNGKIVGYWQADEVVQRPANESATQEELSSLHEAHLQRLAQTAGLTYQRLTSEDSIYTALENNVAAQSVKTPTDIRWLPAVMALLLIVWRFSPR